MHFMLLILRWATKTRYPPYMIDFKGGNKNPLSAFDVLRGRQQKPILILRGRQQKHVTHPT